MQLSSSNKILILFILLTSFTISIGYSALNASLSVSGDLAYRVPADIRITDVKISTTTNGGIEQYTPNFTKDTVSFGLKLPNLNSTVTYEVTVTNKSSQAKLISDITNKIIGNANIVFTYNYNLSTTISANSSVKILFTFKYNSGVTSTSAPLKENTIAFTFADSKILYQQIKNAANDSTKNVALYTGDTSTFNGNQDVYYYYGDVEDNNVLFATYCWKIVRTTDTGGVKLLYNGMPISGKCNNSGDASALTAAQMGTSSSTVAFNSGDVDSHSLADVGYMYNTKYIYEYKYPVSGTFKYGRSFTWNGSSYTLSNTVDSNGLTNAIEKYHYTCFNSTGTCNQIYYLFSKYNNVSAFYITLSNGKSVNDALNEMLHNSDVNKYNSTIKTAIDYWYQHNMTSYTKYLEDTVWCNDRNVSNLGGWSPTGDITDTQLRFKSTSYADKETISCKNKIDRFTVSSANGNGALTYPVGLLDFNETNLGYYLSNSPNASGSIYWGMSPTCYDTNGAVVYRVYTDGDYTASDVIDKYGVRPAISLKEGTSYSDGDGTTNNPYIILTD